MLAYFLSFLFLLNSSINSISNDVDNYFQKYKEKYVTDYNLEQSLVQSNSIETIIEKLGPYYRDSILQIRQKAYYLTYKRAMIDANKKLAVLTLLQGCNDKDGGIIGQNLDYLKNFHLEDFDEKSVQFINSKLLNHRVQHYTGFVLLAGFVNTGKDMLFQKLLDSSIPPKAKWNISLALARIGNAEQIKFCMDVFKGQKVNDSFVDNIMPDIIYMRQKEGIDFCINVLNSNDKLCHSLNPDFSESIICGYRVIEALAPVVIDIPVIFDNSGFLKTSNYEKMLEDVRTWFKQNPNYQIRKNIY
jgi:hypothetical protein